MQPDNSAITELPAKERPWLFAFLIAPTAVVSLGLVEGALSYLFRREGVDPAHGSEILALLALPHTIFFFWSPITDFWMKRRTWLIASAAAAAGAVAFAFHQPKISSAPSVALLFLGYCLALLACGSAGGLMGMLSSEVNRRRAGSFYQSGSLVFGGVAVLVLVSCSGQLSLGVLGWMVAAMIALPAFVALAAPKQSELDTHTVRETAVHILREFKTTFLRWDAVPYTLLVMFPMCSGAMIGLLPGLAADFGVSGAEVAWVNGLLGTLLTAAGSLSAAAIPIRIRAPIAFLLAGLTNAGSLAVLAFGPMQPAIYFTGTVLYLFTIGCCYALFTGVVLEFLGDSGKSGSARYAIINSLGNVPVAYMIFLDGRGYARWGARAMPATDAVLSICGALLLLTYFVLRPKLARAVETAQPQ